MKEEEHMAPNPNVNRDAANGDPTPKTEPGGSGSTCCYASIDPPTEPGLYWMRYVDDSYSGCLQDPRPKYTQLVSITGKAPYLQQNCLWGPAMHCLMLIDWEYIKKPTWSDDI